jgi:uncharacterized protein
MQRWLRLWLALGASAGGGWAVDWSGLRQEGFVNDFAGVIDAGARTQLEQYCGEVARRTGVRIVLVTLGSLQDEPLEDVSQTIFAAWRDRQRTRDDRVMVLLTVADRRQYVAVGGGVDRGVAAGLAGRVLREMRPALRRRDYAEALRAAAETAGSAAAAGARAPVAMRLPRRYRRSLGDEIPWMAVIGLAVIGLVLWLAGNPAGYGGTRGLIPGLLRRNATRRATWGSRGTGGFGGYDSGDAFGGFGGAGCNDW